MPTLSSLTTVALAIVAMIFACLWWKGRSGSTIQSPHSGMPSGTRPDAHFTENIVYKLLEKHQIVVHNTTHWYGVADTDNLNPFTFLVTENLDHLTKDNEFSINNNQLHKIIRNTPPAPLIDAGKAEVVSSEVVSSPVPAHQNENDTAQFEANSFDEFDDANDRTVMFRPSAPDAQPTETDPLTLFPYLKVTEGPDTGSIFALPYTDTSIGRGETCDIRLSDDSTSRIHCEITFNRPAFVLQDAGSTNGTICNGSQLHEHKMEFGDEIQVADTVMVFSCTAIDLKATDPEAAIAAFESYLQEEPEFLLAMKNLAFLLERDIRRKKEADPLWKEVARLEKLP